MPAFLPSELPERCRTRHHWVVLLRPPHKFFALALVVLLLAAILAENVVMWILLILIVGVTSVLRFMTWRAELIILTSKRVIRVQGIPETTTSETSLKIDRVSGARLIETVPGKILGYGSIELEAPGDHPGVRKLMKIHDANRFYLELRNLIFGESTRPDPNDDPREYHTEPLPVIVPDRDRFGRRRF